MRSLSLCFLVLFLFGCETTESEIQETPKIFTHFEPKHTFLDKSDQRIIEDAQVKPQNSLTYVFS